MKLVRYGPKGREQPGIIDADGQLRSLSKIVADINGEALSSAGLSAILSTFVAIGFVVSVRLRRFVN